MAINETGRKKKLRKIIVVVAVVLIVMGAWPCYTIYTKKPPQNPDDVLEAVVRYEIADKKLPADFVYFICIRNTDPTDEFLLRFNDIGNLRKFSKAKRDGTRGMFVDIETGKEGFAIGLGSVEFNEDGTSTAGAFLPHAEFSYTLKRQGGKWVVGNAIQTAYVD